MSQASYEAVATSRPRIRRDVLFTQTPEGVLFHNSDGGFRLNAKTAYRFATLIVPHLTGEHSVAELCQGLGEPQRAMVGELVKTLYERDFARSVAEPEPAAGAAAADPHVARRFSPQIAYADHYADDAEARFLRFRGTRVAVLGEDRVALWCALSLVRNGCAEIGLLPGLERAEVLAEAEEARADGAPVRIHTLPDPEGALDWGKLTGFDFVVVTGGTAAPGRLFPLLRAGIPEGRSLLPAWTYGSDAVVGPLMTRGTAGCWACAALRLGAARGGAGAAELWSSLALPDAGPAAGPVPGRPLAAMIGNLLGYEVFRATSGALPAETAGRLLVQDMASLDVTAEPLFPHPRCPFCADAEPGAPVDLAAAGTTDTPALPTLETARDADALVEELNRRSALVRPAAGVFTRYADEELTQLPLKLGVVELGIGHAGPRSVAAFDIHHVAGARMRALDAAALVYAEHVVPARGLLTDTGRETPVAPSALATSSGIPGGAGAHQRAFSLLTKEPVLVPAGAVRPFGPHNAERLFERSRAGAGAGPSPADAAAAGLLSALGHAALLRAVRGAAAAAVPLPAPDGEDAELGFLVRSAERLGMRPELLDLGEGARSGAAVLLARSGGRWALGAGLDRRTAAVAALRELLGAAQYEADEAGGGGPADTGDPLLADLDARALAVSGAAGPLGAEPAASWDGVLERLAASGLDAYVAETGSRELAGAGIHTVRVLLTAVREPGDDA
ncbi:TOMM precursor leader peptide-binding protein [Streptomyces sp. NPDC006512]|uniref:TOMM precursor leader peptide-binding protein n=1 Tax=Streptomyces sp. NPDC006512 TaxID=3154307 RepID=UPI00339FC051